MQQPAPSLASVPPGVHAVFSTQDGGNQFTLISDRAAIGRFDPVTGMRPDVDLSAVDINRSVSRHHARLVRQGSVYNLTEEVGALNGTFINGKRLTTGKPVPLRDGDEIGLGMVRMRFHVLTGSLARRPPGASPAPSFWPSRRPRARAPAATTRHRTATPWR